MTSTERLKAIRTEPSGDSDSSVGGRLLASDRWLTVPRVGVAIFVAAAASAATYLMTLGSHLTFFYDEWDFVSFVRSSYWHAVVQGHSGHPSMIPYTLYWALLHTVGLRHYWPYLLILVLLDVLCGWLIFSLLRSRLNAVVSAGVAGVLMLLGPAWQDLLWAFQLAWLATLAAGAGALLLIERRTRQSDIAAGLCLLVAVGSSGLCVPVLAGVGVELLWHRTDWSRLWIPAIPSAVFLAWYLRWGRASAGPSVSQVGAGTAVHFVGRAEAATVGALTSTGLRASEALTVVILIVAAAALLRRPRQAQRLAMAATASVALWAALVVERGAPLPYPSRYIYPSAVFTILVLGEAAFLLGVKPGKHARFAGHRAALRGLGVGALLAGAVCVMWRDSGELVAASQSLGGLSARIRVDLGADQLAAGALPADFQPAPYEPQITSGWYRLAIQKYGKPGMSRSQLEHQSESARSEADSVLARGLPFIVTPVTPVQGTGTCAAVGTGTGRGLRVALPRGGLVVSSPNGAATRITAGALADEPTVTVGTVAPGHSARISWSGASQVDVQWHVWLATSGAGEVECSNWVG